MRAEDEDVAYNREVLREMRAMAVEREETQNALTSLRASLFRALGLLYDEVQELRKAVKYWQWATITICCALLGIVAIALIITWYVLVHTK